MSSSIQIKKTPASAMGPATATMTTRGSGIRQSRLSPDQEQAITEAVSQFYLVEGDRPKVHVYRHYLLLCAQTNTPPVAMKTFYWRLRGHPACQPRPRGPLFMAVALIDETVINFPVCGGTSS